MIAPLRFSRRQASLSKSHGFTSSIVVPSLFMLSACGGDGVSGSGAGGSSDPHLPQLTETGGADVGASGGAESSGGGGGGSVGSGGESSGGTASSGGSSGGDGAGGDGPGGTSPAVTWPLINGIQWADTDGKAIQAHGGGMLKVGAHYYWFGENRNPDGTFFAVSAYRSTDLRRWEFRNHVLTADSDPGLDPANVERPKVVYNATTKKYVMWMHWENGQHYGEARAAVASSDTVDGDYDYYGSFRPLADTGVMDHGKPGYMSRDCTLFVDDDGTGYFLSSSNENYDLHLYELSADYLSIEKRAALLFEGGHREAPALFKRNDTYFLISSGSTGWSPNQARYATSSSLTSGWSALANVGDGTTFYSQSTYVQPVEGSAGSEFLYMGDRWAGAYGGPVNDSSYVWQKITFPSATSMSMTWANTLDIDSALGTLTGSVHTFKLKNKKSGLSLEIDAGSNADGADAIQGEDDQESSEHWRLNYDGSGYFRFTNLSSGKVLDVPDESKDEGIFLHQWANLGGDNQLWRLNDQGEGFYLIRNKNSDLVVAVSDGSSSSGASIEQAPPSDGAEQLWELVIVP